jgi:hypothetical protein
LILYDLTRAPGGSSGGSAVAATMNFATATSAHRRLHPHPELPQQRSGPADDWALEPRRHHSFSRTQDVGGPVRGPSKTSSYFSMRRPATTNDPSPRTARKDSACTHRRSNHALKGARIGALTGISAAAEDIAVAIVVKRAIDDKRTGATTVAAILNLAAMVAASNVFLQEIKASLGGYLKTSGAPVASVELSRLDCVAQLQGILDIANRTPDDYFESDEHRRCLAARDPGRCPQGQTTAAWTRLYPALKRTRP